MPTHKLGQFSEPLLDSQIEEIVDYLNRHKHVSSDVSAAGSDKQVQFNDGGAFAGAALLYWDKANNRLSLGTSTSTERLNVSGNVWLINDSDKIVLGAGKDMTVYYSGAQGVVSTKDVAPSDLLVACGTDKTLVLEEPVWNDINLSVSSLAPGATGPGNWTIPGTTLVAKVFTGTALPEQR